MPNIELSLAVNSSEFKINISGLDGDLLVIEYAGDIDVTEFVDKLAEAIDGNNTFSVTAPSGNVDEKTALVLGVINNIVQKFNEVVVASTVSENGTDTA